MLMFYLYIILFNKVIPFVIPVASSFLNPSYEQLNSSSQSSLQFRKDIMG